MPFSAILLVFKFLMFSFLQVCKFTDLQVHNSIDCPYFYGLSVKISDLLHLVNDNMFVFICTYDLSKNQLGICNGKGTLCMANSEGYVCSIFKGHRDDLP